MKNFLVANAPVDGISLMFRVKMCPVGDTGRHSVKLCRSTYLQGGGGADMCRRGVPLPALQPVDVAHTRTGHKEKLATTLPDLQLGDQ